MQDDQTVITFLTEGMDDPRQRDAISRAYFALSSGDPNSAPVQFALFSHAVAKATARESAALVMRMGENKTDTETLARQLEELQKQIRASLELQQKSQVTFTQISSGATKIAASWSEGCENISQSLATANRDYLVAVEKSAAALPQSFTPRIAECFNKSFKELDEKVRQMGNDLYRKCDVLARAANKINDETQNYKNLRWGGLGRVAATCTAVSLVIGFFIGSHVRPKVDELLLTSGYSISMQGGYLYLLSPKGIESAQKDESGVVKLKVVEK